MDKLMKDYLDRGGKITICKATKAPKSYVKVKGHSKTNNYIARRLLMGYKSYKQLLKDET